MQTLPVKIKRLDDKAVIPSYSKEGDAGLDFTATDGGQVTQDRNGRVITYSTGIAMAIPEGFVGLMFPRSSVTSKTSLLLGNCVGVIDSGYRGEIKFQFRDLTTGFGKLYKPGERIGQMIIIPYPQIEFEEVSELTSTDRGAGGFGSTGN